MNIFAPFLLSLVLNFGISVSASVPAPILNGSEQTFSTPAFSGGEQTFSAPAFSGSEQGILLAIRSKDFFNVDFSINLSDCKNFESYGTVLKFPCGINLAFGIFDSSKVYFHKPSANLSFLSQSTLDNAFFAKSAFFVPTFSSTNNTLAFGTNFFNKNFAFGLSFADFENNAPKAVFVNFGFGNDWPLQSQAVATQQASATQQAVATQQASATQRISTSTQAVATQQARFLGELTLGIFEYSESQNQNSWYTKKKFVPKTAVPIIVNRINFAIPFANSVLKLGNDFRIQDSPFKSLLICNTTECQLKSKMLQIDFGLLCSDYEFIFVNSTFATNPLKVKFDFILFLNKAEFGVYYICKLKNNDFCKDYCNDFLFKTNFFLGQAKIDYSIEMQDFDFYKSNLKIKNELSLSLYDYSIFLEDKAKEAETDVKISFNKKNISGYAKTTLKKYKFYSEAINLTIKVKKLLLKNTFEFTLDKKNNLLCNYNLVGTLKL